MVHLKSSALKQSPAAPCPGQGQHVLKLSQVVQVSVSIFGTVANARVGGGGVHAQSGPMVMVRDVHVKRKSNNCELKGGGGGLYKCIMWHICINAVCYRSARASNDEVKDRHLLCHFA